MPSNYRHIEYRIGEFKKLSDYRIKASIYRTIGDIGLRKNYRLPTSAEESVDPEANIGWLQEGSLIISQVKAEDGGVYVCEITNGIGRPQRASAALAVECKYILIIEIDTILE